MHTSGLSITLDAEMLGLHGVKIAPAWTPDTSLPRSLDPRAELGDRFLVKYVRKADRSRYSILSGTNHFPGVHYFTPTALCRDELVRVLNLPPFAKPGYAILVDPSKIDLHGPRYVRGGSGIEYLALNGFPGSAIVPPGWPIRIG